MMSMYKWHQVKVMSEQGKSIKQISKELDVARNTVRQYIRETSPPVFKGRRHPSCLEKYKADIAAMLEKRYIGTRIYEELKRRGYAGSLSAVHSA
jgi:transposase